MPQELMTYVGETITQIIAFLIFFWVIKKFAWPALTRVMDDRQRQIEEGFADIRRRQADAERLHNDYAERLRLIEQEARAKVQEAIADGQRVAQEITDKAHEESREIVERARRTVEIELDKARIQLRNDVTEMTIKATERLLRQNLDEANQRRLVDSFITDLESRGASRQ